MPIHILSFILFLSCLIPLYKLSLILSSKKVPVTALILFIIGSLYFSVIISASISGLIFNNSTNSYKMTCLAPLGNPNHMGYDIAQASYLNCLNH